MSVVMTAIDPKTQSLVDAALAEDLGHGDITTDSLFLGDGALPNPTVTALICPREPGIISGLSVAEAVFLTVDPSLKVTLIQVDGDPVVRTMPVLRVEGALASILKAERTALNFLQYMSGIATLTYQYMGAIGTNPVELRHTRKTHPTLRHLAIQAVVDGGGHPHRANLSEAIMIKDNHLWGAGGMTAAVNRICEAQPGMSIEVECDNLAQVQEAVTLGVETIMLDNFTLDQIDAAVTLIQGKAQIEVSGGVTLSNIMKIAKLGVNVISTSQITMSAPAMDLGLDFQ